MELTCVSAKCPKCTGSGIEHIDEYVNGHIAHKDIVCRRCDGVKRVKVMCLNEDLTDMLVDMKDRINDIWEKLNE